LTKNVISSTDFNTIYCDLLTKYKANFSGPPCTVSLSTMAFIQGFTVWVIWP